MDHSKELISRFKNSSLELDKTLTSTLNSGGAVSYQIIDVVEFIVDKKLSNEVEFLLHLLKTQSLTQEAIECFFKHMMFSKKTALSFVQWQRENSSLLI
jgi:hypothetical protein